MKLGIKIDEKGFFFDVLFCWLFCLFICFFVVMFDYPGLVLFSLKPSLYTPKIKGLHSDLHSF